jgi:hypothetical protein
MTNIYVCRAFSHDARQTLPCILRRAHNKVFLKISFWIHFYYFTTKTLFCTLHFILIHVSVNILFVTIMCDLRIFAVYVKFELQVHKVMQ